jgi:iron(II)-dependent oxidoreductase
MTAAPLPIESSPSDTEAGFMSASTLRESIAAALEEARARTLMLIEPLSDEDLTVQHDSLMSPILWDLGHIAHFEELWLVRNLEGPVEFGEMPGMYNPFEHPRRTRGALDLPTRAGTLQRMAEIRARVLERLSKIDFDPQQPLVRDGYVYNMVLQHEYQHNETILQTLQLKTGKPYAAPRRWAMGDGGLAVGGNVVSSSPIAHRPSPIARFNGGIVQIGTNDRRTAYDNERPAHEIELAPFTIDVAPTSSGEYLEFMNAGGYTRREWWSNAGWAWLQESGVDAPKHWFREGGAWRTREMDRVTDVDPKRPVSHVCYHEADAYARFAGKRLPTEFEWEVAAGWNPSTATMQRFPWGDAPATPSRANVDQLSFGVAPIGAYDSNWSPLGCYGMIGDVWEWTSSDFRAYPGYQTFPYPEYSEVFFGDEYKVLRGGSWATRPGAIRNSFRNWDYPIRRQIFSGFRCAADD